MTTRLKPWSILSSFTRFSAPPWLRVRNLTVRLGDGHTRIDNFMLRTGRDSCLIVPFLSAEQVVVVRQYKLAISKALVEFPAGYMNDGETPLECAQRELAEETGFRAGEFVPLGVLHREPHYSPTVMHIWLARELERVGAPSLDGTEELVSDMLSEREISDRIAYGEISSVYCVAAWSLVKEYLA